MYHNQTIKDMMTIKSYLPIFQGFYGTLFECNAEEREIENYDELHGTKSTSDDFEFDYEDYNKRVAQECISSIWNFLKLDGFEIDVNFEGIHSPRFYNYTNDSINCIYLVNKVDLDNLVNYCKDNLTEFEEFLRENFTSDIGRYAYYSNNADVWFEEYLKTTSDDFEGAFAEILGFYLENEGYTVDDMVDDCQEEMGMIDYKPIK